MENQKLTPQVFEHSHFGKLRVILIDGVVYFVGRDVAKALGYKDIKNALRRHVDPKDKLRVKVFTPSQRREMIVINKSGVYSLVLDSQLPLAKEYRHWVTSVVLPKVDEQGFFVREEVVGENISLAEFNALKEQVLGLTATFNQWLADMQKQLTPCQRADKLLALADKIKDDEARDKILLKAANLLIGKHIF